MSCVHISGGLSGESELTVRGGCCNIIDGSSPNDEVLKKSKHLSEFVTKLDKALARKNLGIPDEYTLKWGNITGDIREQKDLYEKLEELQTYIDNVKTEVSAQIDTKISKELDGVQASTQIRYDNLDYPEMKNIKDALDQILYRDLVINLTCSPNIVEDGSVISSILYKWTINKDNIISQIFDGIELNNTDRQYQLEGSFTSNVTKTLVVDDGTKSFSKSVTLSFYPGLYYGTSSKDSITTQDIIEFNYKLLPNRQTTVTVNADLSSYIYICIPYSYGEASFKVGGFEGGFELIDDQFVFNKYKEMQYRIYRSDNKGLGNTTITII